MVLILVLIVVAMLSLGAYSFTHLMLAHHDAARQTTRQAQARSLVDSGVEGIRLFLSQPNATRQEIGGAFDNPATFSGVVILDDQDPNSRGCYSVVSPNIDADGNVAGIRFGLENESTRLNLNTLTWVEQTLPGGGRQLLMALPEMTEETADAILDWLDSDEEPREYGCENEYYSGLNPPYAAKNGPIETVEELLLVRGVTPQLLFGTDSNRNFQLDPHEEGSQASGGSTEPDAFRGWSAYLTLHSMEWNITPDRQPRIYLNSSDLERLYEDLAAVLPDESWAKFIIAYRQVGAYTNNAGNTANITQSSVVEPNMDYQAKTPLAQILDLADAQVLYPGPNNTGVLVPSPFTSANLAEWLPLFMQYTTINPAATIPGRININQASATVLSGIPGITPEIVQQILTSRTVEAADETRLHETWLLTEGIVTLAEMRALMPFITCGGDVYRAQVVGYFQGGQASSRAEVVFDATTPLPRIVLWRDISHLGRGFALQTLGVDAGQ